MFKPLDSSLSNSGLRRREVKKGDVTSPSILILESISRANPLEGKGRLWIRNDTPNVIVFTNDVGQESVLGKFEIREEGVTVGSDFTTLDFVGSGITASDGGNGEADITLGVSSIGVEEEGVSVGSFDTLNFVGTGITATDGGSGEADITGNDLSLGLEEEGVSVGDFNTLNFIGTGFGLTSSGTKATVTLTTPVPTLEEVLTVGANANGNDITNLDTAVFTGGIRIGSDTITDNVLGNNGIEIGKSAGASGTSAIAIGVDSSATGTHSISIGQNTVSTDYGFAFGTGATASGQYGIGVRANATGLRSIAIKGNATNTDSICTLGGGSVSGSSSGSMGNAAVTAGTNSFGFGNTNTTSHDYSFTIGDSIDSRTDYETAFNHFRFIRSDVSTTDTTLTNAITFTLNSTEIITVDCTVTELNTEGTVGTLNDSIVYNLRDFHFRRTGGTASVNAGSTTTSNPDGASVSTISLGVSGNDLVLNLTAADNDDRTWTVSMTIYCCDNS